jgi:hypothetical protein
MPGNSAGMSQSWVKLIISSSTRPVVPTVRDSGVTIVSAGHLPMNQVS